LIPSIRFEFIGGSEMVPLGAQVPPKPLSRKNKRRTDDTSLKGSGTGNAVTRGNLFLKNRNFGSVKTKFSFLPRERGGSILLS
jgi:hypothetical protein